jgi:histone deacetylase HOS3
MRTSRRLSGASTVISPTEQVSSLKSSSETSGKPNIAQNAGRPELAAAGRSQSAGNLPVKKTKAPARKEPVKSARGQKKSTSTTGGIKAPVTEEQQQQSPGSAAESTGDDMDKITSGMRKIKINLITQSQKEAKERARARGEGSSAPTPSEGRSTRSGRSTPIVSPTTELPSLTPSYGGSVEPSTPDVLPASDPGYVPEAANQPSTRASTEDGDQTLPSITTNEPDSSAPTSSPVVPQVAVQPSSDPADVFIPYQPEGPAPVAATPSEPLQWLPPNMNTPSTANTPAATPSPVKKRDNLFHYTPGSIPFAPRPKSPTKTNLSPPQEVAQESKPGAGSSGSDIPETPSK